MPKPTVGELIRAAVAERGTNLSQLAAKMGKTRQALSRWASGDLPLRNPQAIDGLAAALDLDPDALYAAADTIPPPLEAEIVQSATHIKAARKAVRKVGNPVGNDLP